MTLRVTHRPPATGAPWYVTCDQCGYYTLGERFYVETLDGIDCPACTDPDDGQLQLVELEPGEWALHRSD